VRHSHRVGAPEVLERFQRAQDPSTRNRVRPHRILNAGKALLEGLACVCILRDSLIGFGHLLAMDVDGELRRLLEDRGEAIQDRCVRVSRVKIPREGPEAEHLALHQVVELDLHGRSFLGLSALQHFGGGAPRSGAPRRSAPTAVMIVNHKEGMEDHEERAKVEHEIEKRSTDEPRHVWVDDDSALKDEDRRANLLVEPCCAQGSWQCLLRFPVP